MILYMQPSSEKLARSMTSSHLGLHEVETGRKSNSMRKVRLYEALRVLTLISSINSHPLFLSPSSPSGVHRRIRVAMLPSHRGSPDPSPGPSRPMSRTTSQSRLSTSIGRTLIGSLSRSSSEERVAKTPGSRAGTPVGGARRGRRSDEEDRCTGTTSDGRVGSRVGRVCEFLRRYCLHLPQMLALRWDTL